MHTYFLSTVQNFIANAFSLDSAANLPQTSRK